MIQNFLFYAVLFGLACLYLAVGLWAASSVRTLKNYFLADRNLGIFKLTIVLIASQLGSGIILGTAYRAYFIGFWGLLYTTGISLGFIILGCGLAARMRSLNISTTAEIFQTHYGSNQLKMIASVISIISLWGIVVAQMVASKALFIGLKVTDPYIFISFWSFMIAYNMIGGLASIVLVDIVQVAFIATVFVWAFKWTLSATIIKYITPIKLAFVQNRLFKAPGNINTMFPVFFMTALFSLIEQDVAQKFFAAKTRATATIASLLAACVLILFSCIPIYFGIMAKIKNADISNGANPLISVLEELCPEWLFLLTICAILAAIMATTSSLLCAISSNVVQDFTVYLHFENKKLWITKIISLLVSVSALAACAFIDGDIIEILETSYRFSVICLFVPICIAYLSKPMPATPAWSSICAGAISYMLLHFTTLSVTARDLTALSCSLLGFLGAYLFIWKKTE